MGRKTGKLLLALFVLFIGENLGKSVTVSTKIPKELREKMKQLNIKPSSLLRKAIEDETRRREAERVKEDIERMKPTLNKVNMKEIVQSIRENRNHR